jgi:hypothetical protein
MPAALLALTLTVAASPPRVRVQASELVAPCVRAAAAAWAPSAVVVEEGPLSMPDRDLYVGAAVELTRALESGVAEIDTDADLARIPWVVEDVSGTGVGLRAVGSSGRTLTVPAAAGAYEARRAAQAAGVRGIREAGGSALRDAPLRLVPLSLARSGSPARAEDVPPLVARAAAGGAAPARARDFLAFLTSEEGRAAFAECRPR